MLAIKLSRTGKKKQPYYRIVVLEKNKDPWGDYKELLGNYNPRTKELVIKEDRLKYWISVGAQMSNTVSNLMVRNNIVEQKVKKAVTISKKRLVKLTKKKKDKEEAIAKAQPKEVLVEEKPTEETIEEKKDVGQVTPTEKVMEEKEKIVEEKKEEEKESTSASNEAVEDEKKS